MYAFCTPPQIKNSQNFAPPPHIILLPNYLRDKTCLTSADANFIPVLVESVLHISETSDSASKLRIVAICVNLENLSLMDQVVTFVK